MGRRSYKRIISQALVKMIESKDSTTTRTLDACMILERLERRRDLAAKAKRIGGGPKEPNGVVKKTQNGTLDHILRQIQ